MVHQGAPGGLAGLAFDKATTDPTATQAPATSPTLISNERLSRCFAGAIAAPTGRDAGAPFAAAALAAAAPDGTDPPLCV